MFNPIARPKVGVDIESMKRVWCAENVTIAYEAFNQGLPLIDKPWITGAPHQRKVGVNYQWSDWEYKEAIKCRTSIIYFAETYCHLLMDDQTYKLVKLFKYQKKILKAYENPANRYIILLASRQMGKTTTTAICLLWTLLFDHNAKIALLGDKNATAIENLLKIKQIYNMLPFFLKPGVVGWNNTSIAFDNGNSIFGGPCNLGTIVGRTITVLYFDELAIPDAKLSKAVVEFAFPTVSALKTSKIVVSSSPRGDNIFKELWVGAITGSNTFIPIRIDWWEKPGRDQKWKQEQIGLLGSEGAFEQQYGNRFLASDMDWLTEEITGQMQKDVKSANWVSLREVLDKDLISKLEKVEKTILLSKFKEKIVSKPQRSLVDCCKINTNLVTQDLKMLPFVFTIDTSEGRRQDHTIVNGFIPGLNQTVIDKIMSDEMVDDDFDGVSVDYAEFGEFDDIDDDIDVSEDSLDNDFLAMADAKLRQAFIIDTDEHSIAMVALFMQILMKRAFNEELCKIVCERDGLGSVMQTMLLSDIVNNSGLDHELMGSVDGNRIGILMGGKNKANHVKTAFDMFLYEKLVCTHELSYYELTRFGLVGKKWEGNGCHDDHSMTFVMAGAYMACEDFADYLQDVVLDGVSGEIDGEIEDYDFD